jgi:hypothetical protein
MNAIKERLWIHRLPWRRKGKDETMAGQIKFQPRIEIVRQNDWGNLALQLVNQSSFTVWIGNVGISLVDLDVQHQFTTPMGCFTHQVLQYIEPKEIQTVSIANAVYDAAGRPQGPYSCLLLANVRYSVFDEWCEASAATCRISMMAMNVIELHSARWYDKEIKSIKC